MDNCHGLAGWKLHICRSYEELLAFAAIQDSMDSIGLEGEAAHRRHFYDLPEWVYGFK